MYVTLLLPDDMPLHRSVRGSLRLISKDSRVCSFIPYTRAPRRRSSKVLPLRGGSARLAESGEARIAIRLNPHALPADYDLARVLDEDFHAATKFILSHV